MQVDFFQNLDHFDVTFNLIESPPNNVLETFSAKEIFCWLSKWQLAHGTKILNFARANLLEVPLEFASLDTVGLTEIDFSSNHIAAIPDIITRFHSLTILLLNDNVLQFLPNTVFSLSKLQTLAVQDNLITGSAGKKRCLFSCVCFTLDQKSLITSLLSCIFKFFCLTVQK